MPVHKVRLAEARVAFIDRQHDLGRSAATIRLYNNLLGRLVRDLGDLQMVNVSTRHVEEWIYGLRREHRTDQYGRRVNPGVSAETFNKVLSCLRVFFKWAQGAGLIRHNPTANLVSMPEVKKNRLRPAPHLLSAMVESAAHPRDRAFLAVAVNTALRQSDILRIRIKDVSLDSEFISVVIGKTGDADEKPITFELDQELRRWFVTYQDEIGRGLADDDFLIPAVTAPLMTGRQGGLLQFGPKYLRPEHPAGRMEKVVQSALASLGLPTKGEGTHTIRRAVARAYYDDVSHEQGDVAALRETAALLNHANLHTTERYLGMNPERSRRDRRMKGQKFLTAMVDTSNVLRLAKEDK